MKNTDIELYKTRKELIRQTAEQIIRDFDRFGLEVHFSGNTEMAYEELFAQLMSHIGDLMENQYGTLFSLLYQIDVNEGKILEKEMEFPDHSKDKIITELIIHRELQKVITRNYYRTKKHL